MDRTWFRKWFLPSHTTIRKTAVANRQPTMEVLEDRFAPASLVNPSFEDTSIPTDGNGYTASITGWTVGGSGIGLNPATGGGAPFLNGLTAPDGARVAFIQGPGGSLSQSITGLTVGNTYVVDYYENERGSDTDARARPYVLLDGQVLIGEHSRLRQPAFVHVTSPTFVATSPSMTLTIGNDDPNQPGTTNADNSLLLDHIQVLEVTQPVIANFTFESPPEDLSNNPWPGYGPITGWTTTGSTGINPAGTSIGAPPPDDTEPFLNGQLSPDGKYSAFIQGTGTISQNVPGFVVGQTYVLDYYEAERGGWPGAALRSGERPGGRGRTQLRPNQSRLLPPRQPPVHRHGGDNDDLTGQRRSSSSWGRRRRQHHSL